LNRRGGEKKFESSVGYYASNNEPFSLIIFDIDFFKKVNDTYGHTIGDEVLVGIASIIKEAIRKDDALIRFGGEEFMVLLSNCNIAVAVDKAELFRRQIEAASHSAHKLVVTASFGVVEYKMGITLEKLMEKADALLYRAKLNGRNQVCSELILECRP
jgi:diguanylate cyclase (GGDEF)-like protein